MRFVCSYPSNSPPLFSLPLRWGSGHWTKNRGPQIQRNQNLSTSLDCWVHVVNALHWSEGVKKQKMFVNSVLLICIFLTTVYANFWVHKNLVVSRQKNWCKGIENRFHDMPKPFHFEYETSTWAQYIPSMTFASFCF